MRVLAARSGPVLLMALATLLILSASSCQSGARASALNATTSRGRRDQEPGHAPRQAMPYKVLYPTDRADDEEDDLRPGAAPINPGLPPGHPDYEGLTARYAVRFSARALADARRARRGILSQRHLSAAATPEQVPALLAGQDLLARMIAQLDDRQEAGMQRRSEALDPQAARQLDEELAQVRQARSGLAGARVEPVGHFLDTVEITLPLGLVESQRLGRNVVIVRPSPAVGADLLGDGGGTGPGGASATAAATTPPPPPPPGQHSVLSYPTVVLTPEPPERAPSQNLGDFLRSLFTFNRRRDDIVWFEQQEARWRHRRDRDIGADRGEDLAAEGQALNAPEAPTPDNGRTFWSDPMWPDQWNIVRVPRAGSQSGPGSGPAAGGPRGDL
ncbi:hypothetical protein H696_02094 [Fonticula alba]|uniref:Uncharacterized protein n=1 Tax=Fonticula alba TaxID=691883 RepID=A0A058ZA23_FONAL|nr:hypothetical protein H696_02094 [Fonticula alba]KCV71144.1 hypothetical protein H696_02094 [Fonticula alba]|eukprot:XP_009494267.1 hypothetical protein H696_02094 [Fonticula alba]